MSDDSWRPDAACLNHPNPGLWFPEEEVIEPGEPRKRETPRMYREAKRICMSCVVRRQCLDYALDAKECCGMWGGRTRPERATILRERRRRIREKKKP